MTGRTARPRSPRSSSATPTTPKKDRRRNNVGRVLNPSHVDGLESPSHMTDVSPLPDDAAAFLTECVGEGWTARALAGDASVRRYFRVTLPDQSTRMLAYYPAE